MVRVLMVAVGLGAFLDFFMAIFGMIIILQVGTAIGYISCAIGSFALLCLRLCMKSVVLRDSLLYKSILCAIGLAIFLDFYATANAVAVYIINKLPLGTTVDVNWRMLWNSTAAPVLLFSFALILFLTACPIAFSYLLHEQFGDAEGEDEKVPKKN